jgi:hypothetical protein
VNRPAPRAACALPLALLAVLLGSGGARGQQDDDAFSEKGERAPPARASDSYPRLPSLTALSTAMVERHAPSGCILDGDRLFTTFLAFRVANGDQVCTAEITPDGKPKLTIVTPDAGEYFWPQAVRVAADDVRICFVTKHRDRAGSLHGNAGADLHGASGADVMYSHGAPNRFSPPIPIVTLTGILSRPALLAHAGKVWIAFEDRTAPAAVGAVTRDVKGNSDLYLAALDESTPGAEHLGEAVRVGDGPFGDLQPALAAAPDGALWIAWTQWRGRDFEVLARRFDPKTRALGPVIDVSDDPVTDDFHPALAVGADGRVWLAWDVLDDPRRGRSRRRLPGEEQRGRETSLALACIERGVVRDLIVPAGAQPPLGEGTLLSWSGGLPQLAFDPAGRLLLVHRYFEPLDGDDPPHCYPLLTRTLGADGWSDATLVSDSEGETEEPLVAAGASGLWIVGEADRRGAQQQNRLRGMPRPYGPALQKRGWYLCGSFGPARIQFAFAPFRPNEGGGPPLLRDRAARAATPRNDPLGSPEADPTLSGMAHALLKPLAGAKQDAPPLRIYYGDLHRHSNVSRCLEGVEARPLDRYVFAREAWHEDFFALTDHPGHADPLQVWELCKLVDLAGSPDFCVFQGFEWSSAIYGHENVIYRHRTDFLAAPIGEFETPEQLWARLKEGEAITIPHHPGHAHLGMDWSHFDPRFARLVEVAQAARGSYEFEGCYRVAESAGNDANFVQDALELGLEFGLISSSDHGNGASYAAALAERLDPDAIFDALHDRRTFGSTTKGLTVDFRRDGVLMGRSVKAGGEGRFTLDAHGTRPLVEAILFRDGAVVHALGRPPVAAVAAAEKGGTQLRLRFWVAGASRERPYRIGLAAADGTVRLEMPERTGAERARLHVDVDGPREAKVSSPGGEEYYRRVVMVRFVVDAPPDAPLTLDVDGHLLTTSLKALGHEKAEGEGSCGTWTLQPLNGTDEDPVDLEHGLGVTDLHDEWIDPAPPAKHAWYYARVVDAAGEISWSSPIFVAPK